MSGVVENLDDPEGYGDLLEQLPGATVLARAPGRVNLIGEHTDYNGFPVLPMAIDRSVRIAARPLPGDCLLIRSAEPDLYGPENVPLDQIPTRPRQGSWTDYVIAAARVRPPAAGLELLVAGDIPPAAGLSSSSALVVAAFLALGPAKERVLLAQEARRAERYVGTLSGGMDQAIASLARPGHALRIDFRPLRARLIPMPDSIGVVVAHSGVTAHKAGAARDAYNDRVRQCQAAAAALGAPEDGLLADVPGNDRASRAARLNDPLLARRAGFVFREAGRVGSASQALLQADLPRLGELLNASHAGLRDEYEVSHPAVDALVQRALQGGAAGARVVGAGFGGCVVAVCERQRAADLQRRLGPDAWVFRAAGAAERRVIEG